MGAKRSKQHRTRSTERGRLWKPLAFLVIVLATLGATGWLLLPVFSLGGSVGKSPTVVEVKGSMGGFSPSILRVKAGRPVTVRLSSLDSRFHFDGGGKHQFAIDELGVNIIAPPKGVSEATFTPTRPGVYPFYCDVCCGGRENPDMQGQLIVEG